MIKLLIADDYPANILYLESVLKSLFRKMKKEDFEIDIARDGLEAVIKAESNEHSLIFMDIDMPKMDGAEATKKIRDNHSEAIIIAVTGGYKNLIPISKERLFDDVWSKPISPDKIEKELEKLWPVLV